jgi:hypothetical protein
MDKNLKKVCVSEIVIQFAKKVKYFSNKLSNLNNTLNKSIYMII